MEKGNHSQQEKYQFLYQMGKIYEEENNNTDALKMYRQCR
jgi:hypothetical protein